ncbi:MAG: response regulator [Bacteroidota bacterium]
MAEKQLFHRSIVIVLSHAALRSSCHKWLAELFPLSEIIEAASGSEGIAMVAQHPASIVLLDQHLPDMTGITALHCIRENSCSAAVIIFSVMNEINPANLLSEPGAEAYLSDADLYLKLPSIINELMLKRDFRC